MTQAKILIEDRREKFRGALVREHLAVQHADLRFQRLESSSRAFSCESLAKKLLVVTLRQFGESILRQGTVLLNVCVQAFPLTRDVPLGGFAATVEALLQTSCACGNQESRFKYFDDYVTKLFV